jgi:haloacetate dehalogenase
VQINKSEAFEISTGETTIFLRRLGTGPALLLLHGFPETHLMWRNVAPLLANHFTVICADLRSYGRSGCPPSDTKHTPYTKRAMANDMISVMEQLGFSQFSVAGHDRGGRVAYRLALDHPKRVKRLAVLDIIPTLDVWDRADQRFAIAFWPWILLAQLEPLPERLISSAPDAVVDSALADWGTSSAIFPPEVRAAYIDPLYNTARVHAICEEYRAAATLDYEHDAEDRKNSRRINSPVLVLWSHNGPLGTWYSDDGGALALWKNWADDVRGFSVHAGHFFPEEAPVETANALIEFFSEDR